MKSNFRVDDPSRIAEVRRAIRAIAQSENLDETQVENAALIATEICTNIVKHAQRGEVFLSALSERSEPGVEIVAVDRGPGMSNVEHCLADGFSTTSTAGTGLGAIARLSQDFDIYSDRDRGTVLVARVRNSGASPTRIGALLRPLDGEEVSGDSWAFSERDGVLHMIVADGLGHGIMAARASAEAVAAFRTARDLSPIPVLQRVHGALRSTRGAAVAVARFDSAARQMRYAGLGNIAGVIIGTPKPQPMVSHNGTAGFHSPRIQEFVYSVGEGALLIMHSDGLQTSWTLDAYPGLRRRDPSVIAGVLYRDSARGKDDVCVVVAQLGGER